LTVLTAAPEINAVGPLLRMLDTNISAIPVVVSR